MNRSFNVGGTEKKIVYIKRTFLCDQNKRLKWRLKIKNRSQKMFMEIKFMKFVFIAEFTTSNVITLFMLLIIIMHENPEFHWRRRKVPAENKAQFSAVIKHILLFQWTTFIRIILTSEKDFLQIETYFYSDNLLRERDLLKNELRLGEGIFRVQLVMKYCVLVLFVCLFEHDETSPALSGILHPFILIKILSITKISIKSFATAIFSG